MDIPSDPNADDPAALAQARRRGERLGHQLLQLYNDVIQEPVPDTFLSLLEDADKANETPGETEP